MNRTGTSVGIALLQTWPTLTKPIVYLLGLGSVFTRSAIIMLLIVPAFQAQLEAQIVINEIMQNPSAVSDADGEWFEVFNPTGSPIDLNGWAIQDNGSDTHVINNGGLLLIPAGGFLVLGNNGNFATNGGVTIDYVFSGIAVANGADELVLLDGTLNEVDRVEWDDGATFPDPNGASMSLIDPSLDNNIGSNWCTASTLFGAGDLGTPGAANDCLQVVINEIMQNPSAVLDVDGEWFEVFNSGGLAVDINGWTILDNDIDSHVISNGGPLLVPAGGFLVLGNNGNFATNGGVNIDYVFSGISVANSADELVLLDGTLNEIDRVEWDGGTTFPDPTGASMSLVDPSFDNNIGGNWCTASTPFGAGDLGTPGAANDCTLCLSNADCDDGVFCNGAETCDLGSDQCQDGEDPCTDDGLFCTGVEFCDESGDQCLSTGDPCPGTECNTCQEHIDGCIAPAGTLCGNPADAECDDPDTCDGAGGCQSNYEPGGFVCRASTSECDVAEACTGSSATCPLDAFLPAGSACGDPADAECDNPDTCDGAGSCQDNYEPAGFECRALTGECDVTEYCDGAGSCPPDSFEPAGTPCGDGSDTDCTNPDTCDGDGYCLTNNDPCGAVTDSSLCEYFDKERTKGICADEPYQGEPCLCPSGSYDETGECTNSPDNCRCMEINDFRLLFSPDVQAWVSYKLNASNPGQFYYNVIAYGGADVVIDIPYPFETQGAQPVHIYLGDVAGAGGCFLPNDLDALWSGSPALTCEYLENPVPGEGLSDVQPIGGCSFTIPSNLVPGDDLYYINVHLDYGFEGVHSDSYPLDGLADRYDRGAYISPWSSFDALVNTPGDDGAEGLAIADCQEYVFTHVTDGYEFSSSIQNVNVFKQIAGTFGRVYCDDTGAGFSGYSLELYDKDGDMVQSAATDEDGYYALTHKHKGKPSAYTVEVRDTGRALIYTTDPFFLQGNGWVELNIFQADCGSTWESSTTYGSGKFKNR